MFNNTFSPIVKKCITVLCAALLLATLLSVNVVAAGNSADVSYLDKVKTLENLGILVPEDEMQYSEENLTREKFAQIVSVFYGVPRTGGTVTSDATPSFTDVSTGYPCFTAIETAVGMGAMDGYTDKKFRPLENLTMGEAVMGAVVLLGYGDVVSTRGGGDAEYMIQAQKLNLLGGLKKSAEQAITKGETVELLFRALDTEVLEVVGSGTVQRYESKENKTLLSETLDVYKIEGVLQATDITAVGKSDACSKGFIRVDGYTIRTSEDFGQYLGMYVYAYCSGESDLSDLKLINLTLSQNRNTSYTIPAEDIISFRNGILSYWKNDRTYNTKISESASVIINGTNNPLYSDKDFNIKEGSVTLLDSDGDSKYETIFVKSYITVWVGQVYAEDGTVSIIDKNDTSKQYTLDIKNSDRNVVYKTSNGVVSYDSIKTDSVVSIAADKMDLETKTISDSAEYIEVLISNKQVSGELKEVDITAGKFTIDDTEYELAYVFDLNDYEINPGDTAKYYLNYFDKITAVDKSNQLTYGILYGADCEDMFSDIVQMKIFTLDGVFKVFNCRNKIYIDGKFQKTGSSIIDALKSSSNTFFAISSIPRDGAGPFFQLIKYTLDSDGNVSEIDTVETDSDNPEIEKNHLRFSAIITENTRYFGKSYATTIDGGYVYDGNLKLFRIPSDLSNDEAFSVKKTLGEATAYELINSSVYCFDMDEFKYIPLMIVRTDTLDAVPVKEDNKMIVFEGVSTVLDENEEIHLTINGTSVKSGAKVKAPLKDDSIFAESGAQPGDIIRWIADDLGRVTKIQIAMKNEGAASKLYNGGYKTGYYSDFRITCGLVQNLNNKYILFKYGDSFETSLRNPSAKVLIYDSEKKTTSVGNYDSIKTVAAFDGESSPVFTYQWYTAIQSIVVFK